MNKQEPAFPFIPLNFSGLTKREWFAGMVASQMMAASLMVPHLYEREGKERNVSGKFLIAEGAYKMADALIEASKI